MPANVLIVDAVKKHRQVVRQFMGNAQPDVELVELDPATDIGPDTIINWSQYYLLIIDNQLGDQDGIKWVEERQNEDDFPPVIFLSSAIDPTSLDSSIQMDKGLRLGAESYLFKKHLNTDKLSYYVSGALEKSGAYNTLVIEDDIFDDPEMKDEPTDEISLGNAIEDNDSGPSVESTLHQMWYAKALLQGYENWPFSIDDMLNGKVNIGGYSIDTYLGCRDRVLTFSAHHIKDDKPFAIKLIDRSTTRGQEPPEALKKDLKTLIDNKHPNLVRWKAFHAIDDYVLMVQEFLEGRKLSGRLKLTGVTEDEAISFMLQILSGLEILHKNGMTAGAFSPDNILFRNQKTLVLTHLNNTYYPQEEENINGLKFNYQEALYMSPESIQGRQTDHRTDLYVAGTIFYHMLAGSPPYNGRTTQDVITEHIAAPVPSLPDKAHPLNKVIQGLMMKTPSQRIQSVGQVRSAIESVRVT